jgi:hypothetical protein
MNVDFNIYGKSVVNNWVTISNDDVISEADKEHIIGKVYK